MKRYEERIGIAAPAAKVFDYVSDFTRHGEWAGHGLEVSKEGDGPVAVGTTFATTAKQFGTQRETSTVTELAPGQTFGWDSKGALGRVHHWFTVTDDGGSITLAEGVGEVEPSFLAEVLSGRLAEDSPKKCLGGQVAVNGQLEAL